MKFNKICSWAFIMGMSYSIVASNDMPEKRLVEDQKNIVHTVAYSCIAGSLLAPIGGLMKGCQRRTLQAMEKFCLDSAFIAESAEYFCNHVL